jgi:hypothetical protein
MSAPACPQPAESVEALFQAGSAISHSLEATEEAARRVYVLKELQTIRQQLISIGATQEFLRTYHNVGSGKCVGANHLMLCVRHDARTMPLPEGMMDEEMFYAKLEELDEKIAIKKASLERLKRQLTELNQARFTNRFLCDVGSMDMVRIFFVVIQAMTCLILDMQGELRRQRHKIEHRMRHVHGKYLRLKGLLTNLLEEYVPVNSEQFHNMVGELLERRDQFNRELKCKRPRVGG